MSESAATTVHEAYAFACMRCGYGWEQSYEIEHHVDGSGKPFIIYKADGERVPSPLSRPTCVNCGGHVVRIMRAGRVSTVQQLLHHSQPGRPATEGRGGPESLGAAEGPGGPGGPGGPDGPGGPGGPGGADGPGGPGGAEGDAVAATAVPTGTQHHWQLSDLLHPFHRK